jgi:thiamine biosynthesis lipoprotein ApbE
MARATPAGSRAGSASGRQGRAVRPVPPRGGEAPSGSGWTALGAPVQFVVTDPGSLERGRTKLEAELAAIDLACNSLRPDSEIAMLNRRRSCRPAELTVRVSVLLADAIAEALRTARLTDGDLDPTAGGPAATPDGDQSVLASLAALARWQAADQPDAPRRIVPGWQDVRLDHGSRLLRMPASVRLDLSAMARAWAADRCASRLADALGCGVLIGLGGDIAVAGGAPPGGWRIRIQDSGRRGLSASARTAVVAIHDGGLSTASTTARRWRRRADLFDHIADPGRGLPAVPYWRAVSVAAARCAFASAASTAAIIRGRHGLDWLSDLALPARLVSLDGQVHTVAGWPAAE